MGGNTGSPANPLNVVLETRSVIVVRSVSLNAIDRNAMMSENKNRRIFIWSEVRFYRECGERKERKVLSNELMKEIKNVGDSLSNGWISIGHSRLSALIQALVSNVMGDFSASAPDETRLTLFETALQSPCKFFSLISLSLSNISSSSSPNIKESFFTHLAPCVAFSTFRGVNWVRDYHSLTSKRRNEPRPLP
jgi:hypothetical protein